MRRGLSDRERHALVSRAWIPVTTQENVSGSSVVVVVVVVPQKSGIVAQNWAHPAKVG